VADHVIDADAAGVLVALVADGRRHRAGIPDHGGDPAVDLGGGLAGKDQLRGRIQNARGQFAGNVHPGEIRRLIDADAVLCQSSSSIVHAPALLLKPPDRRKSP